MSWAYPCPCCGYLTFAVPPPGTYDVCPVCRWVDDPDQYRDPDDRGGANELSLAEARRNYQAIGASDPRDLDRARGPTEGEVPPMSARQEIAAVAQAMLDGRVELHEGCAYIAGLRHELPKAEADGKELNPFVGYASMLDEYPVGTVRQLWEPAALAEKDRRRDEYLDRIKDHLLNACRVVATWR